MERWQSGDQALCINDKTWTPDGYSARALDECSLIKSHLFPRVGTVWVVDVAEVHFREEEDNYLIYLRLQGQPSDIVFDARFFKKVGSQQTSEITEQKTMDLAHDN